MIFRSRWSIQRDRKIIRDLDPHAQEGAVSNPYPPPACIGRDDFSGIPRTLCLKDRTWEKGCTRNRYRVGRFEDCNVLRRCPSRMIENTAGDQRVMISGEHEYRTGCRLEKVNYLLDDHALNVVVFESVTREQHEIDATVASDLNHIACCIKPRLPDFFSDGPDVRRLHSDLPVSGVEKLHLGGSFPLRMYFVQLLEKTGQVVLTRIETKRPCECEEALTRNAQWHCRPYGCAPIQGSAARTFLGTQYVYSAFYHERRGPRVV